jgi:hypothetical protein
MRDKFCIQVIDPRDSSRTLKPKLKTSLVVTTIARHFYLELVTGYLST